MKTNKIILALSLVVIFLTGCKKEEKSQLPEVKTYEATVTIASVILSGEVVSENGAAVTTRGFCWSRNPNPELNDSVETAGMGVGEYTYTLDGFTSSETYYYRAFATNASGTSFGAEMSFTPQGQEPHGNPTIELKQGGSYVSTNTEITVGSSILVGINGAKNALSPNNLNRFRFSITSNLLPIVFVDTVFNQPTYSWEVQLDFTGIGQAVLRFELWDEGGNRVEEQLSITVNELPGSAVNKFIGIQLGSFDDAIGSFYSTTDNVVYTTNLLVSNPDTQAKIDFLFYKGNTNFNTIASPDDVSANAILEFQLAKWAVKNSTRFNTTDLTVAEFDAIGESYIFPEFVPIIQTSKVINLSQGDVIMFKTENGRLGLIKIVDLFTRGDVAEIDVVVQQ